MLPIDTTRHKNWAFTQHFRHLKAPNHPSALPAGCSTHPWRRRYLWCRRSGRWTCPLPALNPMPPVVRSTAVIPKMVGAPVRVNTSEKLGTGLVGLSHKDPRLGPSALCGWSEFSSWFTSQNHCKYPFLTMLSGKKIRTNLSRDFSISERCHPRPDPKYMQLRVDDGNRHQHGHGVASKRHQVLCTTRLCGHPSWPSTETAIWYLCCVFL